MQLAIAPLTALLDGPVQCFGVSGYSGAGTTPSDRNDPDKLRDNLMPYALTGHVHEREVDAARSATRSSSCRTSRRFFRGHHHDRQPAPARAAGARGR